MRGEVLKYLRVCLLTIILIGCGKNVLPPGPPEIIVPRQIEFCKGGSALLNIEGKETYEYLWEPSDGISDPTSPSVSISPSQETVYTLTVKDKETNLYSKFSVRVIPLENPVPVINLDSSPLCSGNNINFDASASTAQAPIASYEWDFNGDGVVDGTGINVSRSFSAGNFNITLRVTDDKGCFASTTRSITVNQTPEPAITVVTPLPLCGLTVDFDGSASTASGLASYQWDFDGDASVDSTSINPAPFLFSSAGSFTTRLTVTEPNGCSKSATQKVNVFQPPTASFNSNSPQCFGSAINFTDTSTPGSGTINSWNWDFGDSTNSGLQNPSKNYASSGNFNVTLTVSDTNGCSAKVTNPVTVNPSPAAVITAGATSVCRYGSIDFHGLSSSAVPPATLLNFAWDFNNDSIIDSTAGDPLPFTYTTAGSTTVRLTVTDSNGCSDTETLPITVYQTPTADFTSDAPKCLYVDDNSSVLQSITFVDNSSPGSGTISSWNWDFGDSSGNSPLQNPTHSYITAGYFNVTLTVNDSNGCSDSVTKQIQIYPNPVAYAGEDQDVLIGGTNIIGGITTGGTWPYLFAWSPATYLSSTTVEQPTVDCNANNCSGDAGKTIPYTVLVTDKNNCTDSDSVNVTFKSPVTQLVAKAGPDQVICAGNSANLGEPPDSAEGGTAPYSYVWYPATGLSGTTIPLPTASPANTTTYTLTVTDSGGQSDSDTVTVTVDVPVADAGPDRTICYGASTTIGTPALPNYIYSWSPATGLSCTNCARPVANPTTTTTYTVTVTNSATGCVNSDSVTVTVDPPLYVDAGTNQDVARGASTSLQGTVSGGSWPYTYSWTCDQGACYLNDSTIINPSLSVPSDALLRTVTYQLTATDSAGCSASDTVGINITNSLTVSAGPDRTICPGGSTIIGMPAGGGTPPYTYSWTCDRPSCGLSATNVAQPTASPNVTTTYTVTVTDSSSPPQQDTDSVIVTVTSLPNAVISASSTSACRLGSIDFDGSSSSASPPATIAQYSWDLNGDSVYGDSTVANPPPYQYNTAGSITVGLIVTDTNGCTSVPTTQPITIYEIPTVSITPPSASVCPGFSVDFNGSGSTPGSGTITGFAWDFNGDGVVDSTMANPPPFIYNSPGNYNASLTVTNSNSCSSTGSVPVTVYTPPVASFTSNSPQCFGNAINFTDTSTNGSGAINSWNWDFGDSNTSTLQNPSNNYASAGNYNVRLTVSDTNSCTDSVQDTVTVYPLPVANAGTGQAVTLGGTNTIGGITTGGTPPYNFVWSPSTYLSNTSVEQPTVDCYTNDCSPNLPNPITYTVNVTDANNCSNSDSVLVNFVNTLVAKAGIDYNYCPGNPPVQLGTTDADGFDSADGGSPPYTYSWICDPAPCALDNPNAARPYASPNVTTTYTLQVTDSALATDTDTAVVNVEPGANAGADKSILTGGTATIGTAGLGGYTYSWTCYTVSGDPDCPAGCFLSDSTLAQPAANPVCSMNYTVQATSPSGCVTQDSMVLTVNVFVRYVYPASNQNNVPENVKILITFSEPMDAGTINDTNITLWDITNVDKLVSGTVSYDPATNTAIFTPSSNLDVGPSTYEIRISGVQSIYSNTLSASYFSSFQTCTTSCLDTTGPSLLSYAPQGTNVSINSSILATFNEPLNPLTVTSANFYVQDSGGTPVSGTLSYDIATNTIIFTPSSDLAQFTTYNVYITTGVTDLPGNPANVSTPAWSFTTGGVPDTTPPNVVTTYPFNGATNVPVTASITVTFDEPVDPLTINNTNFKLYGPAGEVSGTVTYDPVTLTATFTPSVFLEGGALYTAEIQNVKDIAGNAMPAPYTWSFTTRVPTWNPGDDPSQWNANQGPNCASNWVQTSTTYVSPPYSWFYDIPSGGGSRNNDCAMVSANYIDLSGMTTVTLGFYQQMFLKDNGPSDDYGLVEVCNASADCTNSANWVTIAQYSGKFTWRRETIDLSAYAGMQIYIRLRLSTDGQVPSQYWYYDDLIITGS